eukprot:CAMPEP_0182908424 /NCGR_PEP_ID=MMETSP0034_2-20130328/35206_1 /TAXON_ID=156128 /ORGANISM="Nephroselmis pyriformis, Strain CCMP717" /LENGTH=127 /DNA_ID=CAMNT_0025044605 /DNA_START=43 /DNA_END=423 /DNA_ORIENTATION=+
MAGCSRCPVSFHSPGCLTADQAAGVATAVATGSGSWECSHHRCESCHVDESVILARGGRGVMYRCACCSLAFCEDHLAKDSSCTIIGTNPLFDALGYEQPPHVCYVLCSESCRDFSASALYDQQLLA